MIEPDLDDVLAAVIDTLERYVAPEVHDEYAASLALTIGQMLRSARARARHEGEALFDDNRELRALLGGQRDALPEAVRAVVDEALAARPDPDSYPSVARLQAEAVRLRAALVAVIDAVPDADSPVRAAVRTYLAHQLGRQEPWLVHAFTGPRR